MAILGWWRVAMPAVGLACVDADCDGYTNAACGGTAPGDLDASGAYVGHHDNGYCMVCHDHNRVFMESGPGAEP